MNPNDTLAEHFRLSKSQVTALKKLGIVSVHDLLYHFPTRYQETSNAVPIAHAKKSDKVTIYGTISKLKMSKGFRTKIPMAEGVIEDASGKIKAVWFHQPYIAKMLTENTPVKVEGTVGERKGELYLSNPNVEKVATLPEIGTLPFHRESQTDASTNPRKPASDPRKSAHGNAVPVYPESRGVTSLWFYHAMARILASGITDTPDDPIPEEILKRYNLPVLNTALIWAHRPRAEKEAHAARKRFAFEEIFLIQLKNQQNRRAYEAEPSWQIAPDAKTIDSFTSRFPFLPTDAQTRAVENILTDMRTPHAMSRLLEGDVGSGKTFVAAETAYAVVSTRPYKDPKDKSQGKQDFGTLQVAYMAPTEILAKQLFESFIEFFKGLPVQVGLITGSGCRKFPSKTDKNSWTTISRPQLLKWVANGEIAILIGTHALIQKSVSFKHLAYVIIDEQHRFGTSQRQALASGHAQIKKQIHADTNTNEESDAGLLYENLSYEVRGAVFAVRNALGSGHKEVVYQKALAEELKKRKIAFDREKQIPVLYEGKRVGHYQPDFIIDEKILIEIKALPVTSVKEKKQLWQYLKGTSYKLAFLVNFGTPEVDIHRVVHDTARTHPRESALDQRVSAKQMGQTPLPHLLSMTATPIPRTLALTVYGDLDLTLLDEMPKGRKIVQTSIVQSKVGQEKMYAHVHELLTEGRQAYVITPRIDEPDETNANSLRTKSAIAEAKRLQKDVFPKNTVDVMHGKMTPKEKDKAMEKFANGDTDILVATSVVEVGVNVPNATLMVIEGAERFGLAQLHQLRGRVMRSTHQAHCYLVPSKESKASLKRLTALTKAANGFELAEEDLKQRGAGELYGRKQWGISDVGMEALQNIKMVEAARSEAQELVAKDPELVQHPLLAHAVSLRGSLHLE